MSCDRRFSALAVSLLLALPVSAAAEVPAESAGNAAKAGDSGTQAQFADAVKLYKDDKFADALPLFERLAADTDSPNARLYVGHCLVKLGRPVEAHRAFSNVLGSSTAPRDDKYDTTREAARAELFALEQRVAKVVVALPETPPGLRVTLDGTVLEPALFGVLYAIEPGEHRLEAVADGRSPVVHSFQVAAGEIKTVSLLLPKVETTSAVSPPPEEGAGDNRSTLRLLGFASLGVGAAGLAVFGWAGISASSVHGDLEAECGEQSCSDSAHRDDVSRGKTLQTVANVGLVVGLAGAAGGVVLLLVGRPSKTETHAGVSVAPGGGLLTYGGRF